MTLASNHWWRETGLRILGGVLILTGLLIAFLSQIMMPRFAGIGLVAGLILAAIGVALIAIGNL